MSHAEGPISEGAKLISDLISKYAAKIAEWWARQDLNPRPNRYERSALTN